VGDSAGTITDAVGDSAGTITDAVGDSAGTITDAVGDSAGTITDANPRGFILTFLLLYPKYLMIAII